MKVRQRLIGQLVCIGLKSGAATWEAGSRGDKRQDERTGREEVGV